MGEADGDDSLLLLQPPPMALRPAVPVQAVAAPALPSTAAEGREPRVGSPTFSKSLQQGQRPSWREGADWNAALAGEPYCGVQSGAPGASSDVARAVGSYGIAADASGEARGDGGGSRGVADGVLINPLLSSLRSSQARSVALYGVTGNEQAPDSVCLVAAGYGVANVIGASGTANAAGATGAPGATGVAGSGADESAGATPGLPGAPGPHRGQWQGSVVTSALGQHLAAPHRPAHVVAAALGAGLPSGGALTRRLWESRLAPREPNAGVEFVSTPGSGAANLPSWQWGSTPAPHPVVAQRVAQPAFPPCPMSVADAPMFNVSGGTPASALATAGAAVAVSAVATRTTPTPAAMAPVVMAPSSSPYLLSSSAPMSAGAASAAAISSAAARSSSVNRSIREDGGGGGVRCGDADDTGLGTGMGREEDDDATRDLWEIIGAVDASE